MIFVVFLRIAIIVPIRNTGALVEYPLILGSFAPHRKVPEDHYHKLEREPYSANGDNDLHGYLPRLRRSLLRLVRFYLPHHARLLAANSHAVADKAANAGHDEYGKPPASEGGAEYRNAK